MQIFLVVKQLYTNRAEAMELKHHPMRGIDELVRISKDDMISAVVRMAEDNDKLQFGDSDDEDVDEEPRKKKPAEKLDLKCAKKCTGQMKSFLAIFVLLLSIIVQVIFGANYFMRVSGVAKLTLCGTHKKVV
jgi:hypothetical protein